NGLISTHVMREVALRLLTVISLVSSVFTAGAATNLESRVLYETRFERSEGFNPYQSLAGQGGWVRQGSGGNGLVSDFITGEGQHAFIGFGAPTNDNFLNVWRPVNYAPGPTNPPVVRFTVAMLIGDSSSTNRDDFRWSVYNAEGNRLFTLDFENSTLGINYLLDDDRFVSTGWTFTNELTYQLEIVRDFTPNQWSATRTGEMIVTNQPITTVGAPLNFGDVDAVWAIREPGKAGDNFMVFDNYKLVAGSATPNPPPHLDALGQLRPGE